MKKSVVSYYSFLLVVVAIQILTSVFQGSVLVHQGYKIAQLTEMQQDLEQEKESLSLSLYGSQSIGMVQAETEKSDFVPITKTLLVSDIPSQVADSSL